MKNLEIIPIPLNLNISEALKQAKQSYEEETNRLLEEFERNKRKLIPHIAEFVHYLVEINNTIIIAPYNSNVQHRLLGLNNGDLDFQEVVESLCQNYNFSDGGLVWEVRVSTKRIAIWLNHPKKHRATPHLPYSVTGFKSVYGASVSDVAKEIIESYKHML